MAEDWVKAVDLWPFRGLRLLSVVDGALSSNTARLLNTTKSELPVTLHQIANDFTVIDWKFFVQQYYDGCCCYIRTYLSLCIPKDAPANLIFKSLLIKSDGSASEKTFFRDAGSDYSFGSFVLPPSQPGKSVYFSVQVLELQPTPLVLPLNRKLQRVRLGETVEGAPPCDVVLCVGDAKLPAHSFVLSTCSDVFSRMLTGNFREAEERRVEIQDASKETIEKMLDYVYTGSIEDWSDMGLDLLGVAHRYNLQELEAVCRLRLKMVDGHRALGLLCKSIDNPLVDSDLRRRWMRLIASSGLHSTDSPEWADFKKKNPVLVDAILEFCLPV